MSDAVSLLRSGAALQQAGRLPDAVDAYRSALLLRPGMAEGHFLLGSAFAAMGHHGEAVSSLDVALKLKSDFAEAWSEMGAAQLLAGDRGLARIALDKAVALAPASAEIFYRRGQSRLAAGERSAAAIEFRRASAIDDKSAAIWTNLATVYQFMERHIEARRAFRRAVSLDPSSPLALNNLGVIEQLLGEVRAALGRHRRSVDAGSLAPDSLSNVIMAMTYLPEVSADRLYRELRAWETRYARARYAEIRPHTNSKDPERRLRIGYLSADFFSHPVGINILGLIGAIDHGQFDTYCYSNSDGQDEVTKYLRLYSDSWCDCRGMTDAALAERIRADRIDILLVMAGHTGRNRLSAAGYKPAPVMISYADLSTTGLEVMDYWLTDGVLSPQGIDERFTETLLHLPMLVLHQPPTSAPEVAPLPALASGEIIFGCCNTAAKLGDSVISLWAQILREVPGSRLLLKHRTVFGYPEVQARFRQRFEAHGIGRERLLFRGGQLSRREQLSLVTGIDVALDPFPFAGCTSTFEALWMGVPVITLAGGRFLGRMGASLLTSAGLTELIATDRDDYRRKAVALARDLPRLAVLRSGLRSKIADSPVCATEPYARGVEMAFREVWRRWCSS